MENNDMLDKINEILIKEKGFIKIDFNGLGNEYTIDLYCKYGFLKTKGQDLTKELNKIINYYYALNNSNVTLSHVPF